MSTRVLQWQMASLRIQKRNSIFSVNEWMSKFLFSMLAWLRLSHISSMVTVASTTPLHILVVVHACFYKQFQLELSTLHCLAWGQISVPKLLSNRLAFYSWRFVSQNTISVVVVQQLSMVSCLLKCAWVLISTITFFSIAAARFSLLIGLELKFSNCLVFLYPVLELLKFFYCRVLTCL